MAPGYEMLAPLEQSDEWVNFPPAVKRKYFSSLERLRLAQNGNATTRAASLSSSYGTVKSLKRDPTSSRPPLARRNSSYFKNPHLRRKSTSPTSDTFSQSDAQWYLRLPPKVQRKHFTKEERELLSGRSDTVVSDAADETFERELYKLSKEANRSVPDLRPSTSSTFSSISTIDLQEPVDSAIEMMDDSMIWFDDDEGDLNAKLRLDDYHTFINNAVEHKQAPSGRGPSFRRALSLSSLPFGAKSLQTTIPPLPALPTVTIPETPQQRRPSLIQQPTHTKQPSIPTNEPSTRHYQDPEARLKLRVYLASPQKFDEAIEFGFPSLEDKESLSLHRPSLSRSHNTAPCKTFLNDDCPSLFDALDDNDDDDTISLPERDFPYTPIDDKFHSDATLLSPSDAASSGSGSTLFSKPPLKPVIRHQSNEPFAQLLAGSREMTLRMTLTRPDLRADEKALYASTTGDDPLALEHLPPAKREEEIWDEGPREKNVVRRFWRRVSGKS